MADITDSLPGLSSRPKPNLPSLLTENLQATIFSHFPLAARFQMSNNTTGRPRARSKSKHLPPGVEDITSLKTSFSLWDGVRELQRRKYKFSDVQYVFLAFLVLFSLYIAPSAPTIKMAAVLGSSWLLLMPATGQFFRPSAMIWIWLLYFFCSRYVFTTFGAKTNQTDQSRFIPYEYRPHIFVRVLPALENVLYGANLSNILSAHKHPVLDVLAWLPYGIIHFGAPLVCSMAMFIFSAPGTAPIFAKSFGWMSILGVSIQLCFPCTPPWYENENGLVPAVYGMPGSPAGLARVDAIFGIDLYTTNFTNAPLPFGAFPSLHAANAVLEALFMSHCFPQFRTGFILYAGWVWWATMYLSHHYAIDLVGGGIIAAIFFFTARARWLPRRQADKLTRWEYEFVETGETSEILDEEHGDYFKAGLLSHRRENSSDGWTVGSGSSWTSGSGTLSPTTSEGTTPGTLVMGDWDGRAPPREIELHEVLVVR